MHSTTLGRPLALRCGFGTSVPEIPPEEISLFPVVRLAKSVESEIADMVETASALRAEADKIENEAVADLEVEITKAIGRRAMGVDSDNDGLQVSKQQVKNTFIQEESMNA